MATTIKRNLVLKELDIKEDPTTGKQRVFSITFDKKNGERVDQNGNAISHPTPVGIDRIIKYNDLSVIF